LCGGDLSEPTWVDEQYILDLERAAALELIQNPKTVERIFHMLSTGKPLRN
jgi:3-hydroxyacyl-CoA dehydrogenase